MAILIFYEFFMCLLLSRLLGLFSLCLTLSIANAAGPFPRGCEVSGFGFQGDYLTFNDTGLQTFYLIQNNSSIAIELEHVTHEETFMNPKLQSKLNPGQWAAFASDVSNTHFTCLRQTAEARAAVSCRNVLNVCQYPRVKFALSNMGTYWVSTNKSQQQVIQEATNKGIYLKW